MPVRVLPCCRKHMNCSQFQIKDTLSSAEPALDSRPVSCENVHICCVVVSRIPQWCEALLLDQSSTAMQREPAKEHITTNICSPRPCGSSSYSNCSLQRLTCPGQRSCKATYHSNHSYGQGQDKLWTNQPSLPWERNLQISAALEKNFNFSTAQRASPG